MATPYSFFYPPLRCVLGDRDPFGNFAYQNADLASALDVLFLCGYGPVGFTAAGGQITPDVPNGDFAALILFRTALMLLEGEDGAGSMRTKALTVTDQGQRKRDLITSFRLKLSDLENGGGIVFETRQSLGVFLQNLTGASLLDWIDASDYKLPVTIMPVALYINPFP